MTLPPRAKRLPRSTREVMGFSVASTTLALLDRVSRATGEARGRIVDASLTHATNCNCAVCLALVIARVAPDRL